MNINFTARYNIYNQYTETECTQNQYNKSVEKKAKEIRNDETLSEEEKITEIGAIRRNQSYANQMADYFETKEGKKVLASLPDGIMFDIVPNAVRNGDLLDQSYRPSKTTTACFLSPDDDTYIPEEAYKIDVVDYNHGNPFNLLHFKTWLDKIVAICNKSTH